MDAVLTPLDKINELYDSYDQGLVTWQEVKRLEQAIKADCPHDRVKLADDEDGCLVTWCADCEEEL